jgi:hypothetical protein
MAMSKVVRRRTEDDDTKVSEERLCLLTIRETDVNW